MISPLKWDYKCKVCTCLQVNTLQTACCTVHTLTLLAEADEVRSLKFCLMTTSIELPCSHKFWWPWPIFKVTEFEKNIEIMFFRSACDLAGCFALPLLMKIMSLFLAFCVCVCDHSPPAYSVYCLSAALQWYQRWFSPVTFAHLCDCIDSATECFWPDFCAKHSAVGNELGSQVNKKASQALLIELE